MSDDVRCLRCDRPLPTAADYLPDGCPACNAGVPCAPHAALCWADGAMNCTGARIDWRRRALAAEADRDAAVARLAAAREEATGWGHGEECPAREHEECGDGGCDGGLAPDECRARRADCTCGVSRLVAHLREETAGDARTLGEARATAETLRGEVARWRDSARGYSDFSARFQRERDEQRAEMFAALGVAPSWRGDMEELCAAARGIVAERDAARAEVALWRGDETVALLGAVAAGKLPRCVTCGDRLATRRWEGEHPEEVCDGCFASDVADARAEGETIDTTACVDLPHAPRLRAAIGGAA